MSTVKVEKYRGNEYKVILNGRLKAKHMKKEKAEAFAKRLDPSWKKPHKKGTAEPSKTAVKLAKKPAKKSAKKSSKKGG